MPYPISIPGLKKNMAPSPRSPSLWPAYPDIPIYLDAADERRETPKTYGTTPTTPTTPEPSPIDPSPTTTIQTSSERSIIWPIPELPPEIQHQEARLPALRFFPLQLDEKTPIKDTYSGLGIVNGLSKPPSIKASAPINEKLNIHTNFAQRIEEKLWKYSADGNILKRWLLEVVSWIFSALCMGAVIGVLIHLKDDSLSKWVLAEKTGLTLNAYISILSKMAGAALILPVSEALGQLKWSWFLEHSKQMWDFEIFDNASRGPWGSILLLIRTKGKDLAALGALIMLCSLALDPFFQQVVSFPDRWTLQNATSAIPRVTNYNPTYIPLYIQGVEQVQTDNNVDAIIKQFFYQNGTQPVSYGNGTRPDIPLSCPTSNCTWPIYETIAVCSKCEEVSHLLDITYSCKHTSIDWSAKWTGPLSKDPFANGTVCGYFLNATSEFPILLSGWNVNTTTKGSTAGEALLVRTVPLTDFDTKAPLYGDGSVNFKNIPDPILDALVASAVDGAESVYSRQPPLVHECLLAWCVQSIKSSYDWGRYSENITSRYFEKVEAHDKWPWEAVQAGDGGVYLSYNQNITLTPPRPNADASPHTVLSESYRVSNRTMANIMYIFDDFFPSTYSVDKGSKEPVLRFKNYADGPSTRSLRFNAWLAPNNITQYMERLAGALTNAVRSSTNREMIPGEAYSRESYVSVRWEWLTLPLGLLCISFVFLAATVAKSAIEIDRLGIYKNSAYATLLYGLSDEMQHKITRSGSKSTPRAKAKELKVKLQANGVSSDLTQIPQSLLYGPLSPVVAVAPSVLSLLYGPSSPVVAVTPSVLSLLYGPSSPVVAVAPSVLSLLYGPLSPVVAATPSVLSLLYGPSSPIVAVGPSVLSLLYGPSSSIVAVTPSVLSLLNAVGLWDRRNRIAFAGRDGFGRNLNRKWFKQRLAWS
ncbi:hypothetical protein ACEQ8H_006261 [Pleosporales sp. CAS-2024a]